MAGRRIDIRGTVQGVGFRPWVYRVAVGLGVRGQVWNDETGVTIEAFGAPGTLDGFVAELRRSPPPAAAIRSLVEADLPGAGPDAFSIAKSEATAERRVAIPPDLATCPDCLRELADPADRRHRYPFTNCTNCGPRFTLACDEPYDRALTTMAPFVLCPACRREYEDPLDRRFHAEPNACPVCGPRLRALGTDGAELPGDPIAIAAQALRAGRIAAVKGLGGFHLACDAASAAAVSLLRQRKRREERPFAVMVRDLFEAERLAEIGPAERALLTAIERPIVLLNRRAGAGLCEELSPKNPLIGLMLPYTPLHHLLLAAFGGPLVMTSGNLSDEPICTRNDEALGRLSGIADLLLVHDREIESRCDDSVARVIAGAPVVLRRSRGYVPRPIALAHKVDRPILAVGGHLKNTFCLATSDFAVLGPHIGDLDGLAACESLAESIARMEKFLRIRPEVVALDKHPDYASTAYALGRKDVQRIEVQHHHAHVASAMAEHGLSGPVLGLAWDGVGLGEDGTAWGGELLLATYEGFERLGSLRPMALPGGDVAVRQVWRLAASVLQDALGDAFDPARFGVFAQTRANDVEVIRDLVRKTLSAPPARGVGRWFDAIGALALARPRATYEGQIALEWNALADPAWTQAYPFALAQQGCLTEVDLRPMVRAIARDLLEGVPLPRISAAFHETLAEAGCALLRGALQGRGALPVVLTGGCFQNARLVEAVLRRLGGAAKIHLHRDVPPGDGGLALGQALVADAVARSRRPASR